MGIESYYYNDLGSENISLDQIRERNSRLIEIAREQIKQIKPSIEALCGKIIEEQPDTVVFLDRGSRLLAQPITKYLSSRMPSLPQIRFYNDDELKHSYLSQQNFNEVVERDFSPQKGKKVFFVDESFSIGKGAAALESAMSSAGIDGYYFALSIDPNPVEAEEYGDQIKVSSVEIADALKRLTSSNRLFVDNNQIGKLFTKDAARLYTVEDENDKTKYRYEPIKDEDLESTYDYKRKKGAMPHARAYAELPDGMEWKEYDKIVKDLNLKTLDELRDLLSSALSEQEK